MGLTSLVDEVSAWFTKYEVRATAVYGQRARPAQGNYKAGTIGGRVSFLWPGEGTAGGLRYFGPRAHEDTIARGGLVALVADLQAARLAHWGLGAPVHLAASSPSVLDPPTTIAEAIDVANQLLELEAAHRASTAAHTAADTTYPIGAPAASSIATLRTLALALQSSSALHDRLLSSHGEADEDDDSTVIDPLNTHAVSHAIDSILAKVEVEIWAWDDSDITNDGKQWDAWRALHEETRNAIRKYGGADVKIVGYRKATSVVHVVRGEARLMDVIVPIPVHELPAQTPIDLSLELTASAEFPKGTAPDGTPIDPVVVPILTQDITP